MGMKKLKKLVRHAIDIQKVAFSAIKEAKRYDGFDIQEMLIEHAEDVCKQFHKVGMKVVQEFDRLREEQKSSPGLDTWLRDKLPDYEGLISGCVNIMYQEIKQRLKVL
jgi:hypothetical protein